MSSAPGKTAYERLKKMQDDRIAKAQTMNDEIAKLDNDINSEEALAQRRQARPTWPSSSPTRRSPSSVTRRTPTAKWAKRATRRSPISKRRSSRSSTAIGKEMGLAAIFNKFESGLVYASDAIDITDTVIKRFSETGGAPAPAKKP